MIDAQKIIDLRLPSPLGVRLVAAAAWAWLLVALPFLTDTATPFPFDLCLGAAWLALASVWFVLTIVSAAAGLRSTPWRRWWIAAGVAGLIGPTLAVTHLGLVVRLFLCERQLTAYATGVAPGTGDFLHDPTTVGLFRVDGTEEYQGAVFLYTNTDFLDRDGLVYFPGGTDPPSPGRIRTHHLYGPWYLFRWHF
jgi:hypothetical protein